MKLNKNIYANDKTKKYFKRNSLFLFFNGINRTSDDWVTITEQSLKSLNFSYYKNFNKIVQKTLKNSTYKNIMPIIQGPTFFIKYNKKVPITKQIITEKFETLFFILLAIKLNSKCYPVSLLKSMTSLKTKKNDMLLYQFNLTSLKY